VQIADELKTPKGQRVTPQLIDLVKRAKNWGYSNVQLAKVFDVTPGHVRAFCAVWLIAPVYKLVIPAQPSLKRIRRTTTPRMRMLPLQRMERAEALNLTMRFASARSPRSSSLAAGRIVSGRASSLITAACMPSSPLAIWATRR